MSGIAVVIPCCDLGRMLGATLDSVLLQSRPADEIVIVDDGSTDLYTRHVLARLDRPRTRIVRTSNRGLAAARNLGIRLTTAPYIVPLDADDLLDPSYLEKAGARLDADPNLDFVSCALQAFEGASYRWTPPRPSIVEFMARGAVHASTMFRRRLWERVGGFDETFRTGELKDFWVSALERGFRGEVLDEALIRYRVRSASQYRRAIAPEAYLATMDALFAKHRLSLEAHGLDVLLAKERFLLEQRGYLRQLRERRAELAREVATLRREVAEVRQARQAQGQAAVDWGELERRAPLSPVWGLDRGKPVNRYYIEKFLAAHRTDIAGRVLEVKDAGYTRTFGVGVTRSDVLDLAPGNPEATLVADLTRADAIRSESFDCVILTQVLNVNQDLGGALSHAFRLLRSGGVLLCTVASVDRVSYENRGIDGDYWRLTEASVRALLAEIVPLECFDVTTYGNLMACTGQLYGLSAEELGPAELEVTDPWFPLLVAVRAVKPGGPATVTRRSVGSWSARDVAAHAGVVLCYHRVATLESDSHGLCVSPADFRAHMEHLRRHYQPMPLEDLVAAAAAGAIPERAVAVTLDDGYLDALEIASPILLELGIPATFFVNSERLDEEHERWWDTLERVLLGEPEIPPRLTLALDGRAIALSTAIPEERRAALQALTEAAWPMSGQERWALAARLREWSGRELPPRSTHRKLTAPEIVSLAGRPGHVVGAHTVQHLALTTQSRPVQRREMFEDKATLERLLGRPVTTFAYPYGEWNAALVELARAAGFDAAVTVEKGLVRPGADPMRLPRWEMKAGDAGMFARRMERIFGDGGRG